MSEVADILLRSIARKIQLSDTLYRKAVGRYETIYSYLDREGSPLRGLIARMYPQGSMMIGASISSKVDNDEFDLDLILELLISSTSSPRVVLDTLFKALNGEMGSRYYGKVTRHTRCVTVHYEDMHLDITPAVLLPGRIARTSNIFHCKQQEPDELAKTVLANPYGFGEWFKENTPLEVHLREAIRAMAEPIKEQEDVEDKSYALIALQLIKRWRNIIFDGRDGRMPPSVMLAKLVAEATISRSKSVYEELLYQVEYLRRTFQDWVDQGQIIVVRNPRCDDDLFTDRWPHEFAAQRLFLRDLIEFETQLRKLNTGTIQDKRAILSKLFGETATASAVSDFNKRLGETAERLSLMHNRGDGSVALGASGVAALRSKAGPALQEAPRHGFYGSGPDDGDSR